MNDYLRHVFLANPSRQHMEWEPSEGFSIRDAIDEGRAEYEADMAERLEKARQGVKDVLTEYDIAERAKEAARQGEQGIILEIPVVENDEHYLHAEFKTEMLGVLTSMDVEADWKILKKHEGQICPDCHLRSDPTKPEGWSDIQKHRGENCTHKQIANAKFTLVRLTMNW